MFTLKNGAQPKTSKVLVVLTDGSQTKEEGSEDPSAVADELRSHGIAVIVVGIGSGMNCERT